METRAPFVIVGAFVLAAIAAVFGFVYWLNNAGGIGKRETYHIVFNGPVPGLLVGAAVLFNGIRVGEVTSLDLVADRPHDVHATIGVAERTPIRADTRVSLDFQGLTGVPVVALEGGEDASAPPVQGVLMAEKGAGQSMTQAARDALRKVDSVLSENAAPLHAAIGNLSTFTDGLARNTPKLDGIVAGLERMTGSATPARKVIYDLKAADQFGTPRLPLVPGLVIAEPTATARLQTQRFLFASDEEAHDDFVNSQWSDVSAGIGAGEAASELRELRCRACAPARGRLERGRRSPADRSAPVRYRSHAGAEGHDRTLGEACRRRGPRQGSANIRAVVRAECSHGNASGFGIRPGVRHAFPGCCDVDRGSAVMS